MKLGKVFTFFVQLLVLAGLILASTRVENRIEAMILGVIGVPFLINAVNGWIIFFKSRQRDKNLHRSMASEKTEIGWEKTDNNTYVMTLSFAYRKPHSSDDNTWYFAGSLRRTTFGAVDDFAAREVVNKFVIKELEEICKDFLV
jgi:hypothetical protein